MAAESSHTSLPDGAVSARDASYPHLDTTPEQLRDAELADVDRSIAALIRLLASFSDNGPVTASRCRAKAAAFTSIVRHADWVVAEYAFVDGEAVTTPRAELLAAFYPDPRDAVLSRYCWALLTSHGRRSASTLIDAMYCEHQAFLDQQDRRSTESLEASYSRQADRHAYRLSLLERQLIIARQIGGGSAAALERQIGLAKVAAGHATELLKERRLARIFRKQC